MMHKATALCVLALLFFGSITLRADKIFCRETFETLPGIAEQVPGFSLEKRDGTHGNVLKIERIDNIHQCVRFPLSAPAGENITFSCDYQGAGYFMILNQDKKQLCGCGISGDGKLKVIAEEQDKWVDTGLRVNPKDWITLQIDFDFGKKSFILQVKSEGEDEMEFGPYAFANPGNAAFAQFGNAYPVGNVSFMDNMTLSPLKSQKTATGEVLLLKNDFEKTNREIVNAGEDFLVEADPEKAETFHKSLKIVRNTKVHNAVNFHFRKILPPQRDFTVSLDYKGIGYVFVQDAKRKQVGAVVFTPLIKVISGDQNNFVSTQMQNDVNTWSHYDIFFHVSEGNFSVKRTAQDGSVSECGPFPFACDGAPVQLQFGNSYPIGNIAYLDNLRVSCNTAISLAGRKNVIAQDEVKLLGATWEKENDASGLNIRLERGEAVVEFHPAGLRTFSLTCFDTAPGMSVSILAVNSAGHELPLAEVKSGSAEEHFEKEGKPILLESAVIRIKGTPGTVLKNLGFWSPYRGSEGSASRAFAEKVQGDFRIPVCEGNSPAQLLLYNRTAAELQVSVDVTQRKSGAKQGNTQTITLHPGENVIPVAVNELTDGEYIVTVTDASPGDSIKGKLRRLLRRQLLTEPRQPEKLALKGKKLYFPDAWQLTKSENVHFVLGEPTAWPLTQKPMTPDADWQHGGAMGIENGKLWVSFSTNNAKWEASSRKNYYAFCDTPDQPSNWKIRREVPGEKLPPIPANPLLFLTRFQTPKATPGADGKEHWKLYQPERDGNPDMRQMAVYCVMGTPDKNKVVWEGVTPSNRTHWPVWHKRQGESLIFDTKPLLVDSYPGDLEEGYESNDNFGGQWSSDDGKTFFYSHGRVVRRFEPLNIPYDNLAQVSRLLTIFRTKDGVHYERAYMVPPTKEEPNGTQHYGAIHFRLKDGGPYLAIILKYYGDQQRYCNDLAYSWDGFNWKRFASDRVFLDNTAPGTWMAGVINPSQQALNYNGKLYWLLNWQTSGYHFYGEFPQDKKMITAADVKARFKGRDLEKWPLFKAFDNDYEKLAADIRSNRMTPAVMMLRQDGFFCAEAKIAEARIQTLPISAAGAKLNVNAVVASNGYLEIRMKELNGNVIASKRLVPGDYLDAALEMSAPAQEFVLEMIMKNCKLYTIGF